MAARPASSSAEALRLFVAIELPEEIRVELGRCQARLAQRLTASVRWVKPEGIHLTLKFLGNVQQHRVNGIEAALSQAAKGSAPLALALQSLGAFPNQRSPRVIWVGLEGDLDALLALQEAVDRGLEAMGFRREARPFSPHLTLGRLREGETALERRLWGEALALEAPPAAVAFRAQDVSLMRSILTPQGAIYSRLGLFPLGSNLPAGAN